MSYMLSLNIYWTPVSARPCANEHCREQAGVTLFKELIGDACMTIILHVLSLLYSHMTNY